MRFPTIFMLSCITTSSMGQSVQTEYSRFLPYEQNQIWLTTTKSLDKSGQWIATKKRFFYKENQNISVDSIRFSPLIVINGVPLYIPDNLTNKTTEKILTLLNEGSIEQIVILDKLSEEWTFHKPFSGAIILTVDKKTEKRISKLNLE